MSDRIPNLHVGDLVRVFTYKGTVITTHSGYVHTVEEDRFKDEIYNPLEDQDGMRFFGAYVRTEEMRVARDVIDQEPEPYLQLQLLSQNAGRGFTFSGDRDYADLRIPESLIRRYQILEPVSSSEVLPLERAPQEAEVKFF